MKKHLMIIILCLCLIQGSGCNYMQVGFGQDNSLPDELETASTNTNQASMENKQEVKWYDEMPFAYSNDAEIFEYAENNILKLKGTIVDADSIIYCFLSNSFWKEIDREDSVKDKTDVRGMDERGSVIQVKNCFIQKSEHYYGIKIDRNESETLKGISVKYRSRDYSVIFWDNPSISIFDLSTYELMSQRYNADKWGEIISRDMSNIIQPD